MSDEEAPTKSRSGKERRRPAKTDGCDRESKSNGSPKQPEVRVSAATIRLFEANDDGDGNESECEDPAAKNLDKLAGKNPRWLAAQQRQRQADLIVDRITALLSDIDAELEKSEPAIKSSWLTAKRQELRKIVFKQPDEVIESEQLVGKLERKLKEARLRASKSEKKGKRSKNKSKMRSSKSDSESENDGNPDGDEEQSQVESDASSSGEESGSRNAEGSQRSWGNSKSNKIFVKDPMADTGNQGDEEESEKRSKNVRKKSRKGPKIANATDMDEEQERQDSEKVQANGKKSEGEAKRHSRRSRSDEEDGSDDEPAASKQSDSEASDASEDCRDSHRKKQIGKRKDAKGIMSKADDNNKKENGAGNDHSNVDGKDEDAKIDEGQNRDKKKTKNETEKDKKSKDKDGDKEQEKSNKKRSKGKNEDKDKEKSDKKGKGKDEDKEKSDKKGKGKKAKETAKKDDNKDNSDEERSESETESVKPKWKKPVIRFPSWKKASDKTSKRTSSATDRANADDADSAGGSGESGDADRRGGGSGSFWGERIGLPRDVDKPKRRLSADSNDQLPSTSASDDETADARVTTFVLEIDANADLSDDDGVDELAIKDLPTSGKRQKRKKKTDSQTSRKESITAEIPVLQDSVKQKLRDTFSIKRKSKRADESGRPAGDKPEDAGDSKGKKKDKSKKKDKAKEAPKEKPSGKKDEVDGKSAETNGSINGSKKPAKLKLSRKADIEDDNEGGARTWRGAPVAATPRSVPGRVNDTILCVSLDDD